MKYEPFLVAFLVSTCSAHGSNTLEQFFKNNERNLIHSAKIIGNLVKITGATLLAYGMNNLRKDLRDIARTNHLQNDSTWHDFWNPTVWQEVDEGSYRQSIDNNQLIQNKFLATKISRPPYIPTCIISTYLFTSGFYGIYKEIKEIIDEHNAT